jgi:hypothetical protein
MLATSTFVVKKPERTTLIVVASVAEAIRKLWEF